MNTLDGQRLLLLTQCAAKLQATSLFIEQIVFKDEALQHIPDPAMADLILDLDEYSAHTATVKRRLVDYLRKHGRSLPPPEKH